MNRLLWTFLLLSILTAVGPNLAHASAQQCQWAFAGAELIPAQKLIAKDDESLRQTSRPLASSEIQLERTQNLIRDMRAEMKRTGGIGIAAPQLGVNQQIIIAKQPKLFNSKEYVLINPRLTPLNKKTSLSLEMCLSLPGSIGLVNRYRYVRVEYLDEFGVPQVLETQTDFAYVLQHEVDHLNGTLFTDKTQLKQLSARIAKMRKRSLAEPHLRKFAKILDKAVEESFDPYSLGYDVRTLNPNLESFKEELEILISAAIDQPTALDRAQAMNQWVRSEAHALFLYDLMNQSGLKSFSEELDYLHQNNVYFIESRKSGNSLITYSFEKEGSTPDITLLYRLPKMTEKEWLLLSEEERIEFLKKAIIPLKTFITADRIPPTELKPLALSGYSRELDSGQRKSYGWEVSHKKYEINRQRLMREVRDLAKMLKQTHSFQVHLAFEIPKKYEFYEEFIYWYKYLNDYLYLRGLEEGLHGNYLTRVANIDSDLGWSTRIMNWLNIFTTRSSIPESQNSLSRYNSKFFSAGLRAKIYGPASAKDQMKIGIELRDSTRNLDLLDEYTERLSQSLESKYWEKAPIEEIKKQSLRLNTDPKQAKARLLEILSEKYANLFVSVEPTVAFGLLPYEKASFYNYRTQSWERPSPEVQQRLKNARAEYEHDLIALEKELRNLKANGEKTEKEIIQSALRMSLSTWAKNARASELLSGF